jgi:hypothetical protein
MGILSLIILTVAFFCLYTQHKEIDMLKHKVESLESEWRVGRRNLDDLSQKMEPLQHAAVHAIEISTKFKEMAVLLDKQNPTTRPSSSLTEPVLPVLTLVEGAPFSTEQGSFALGTRKGLARRIVMQTDGNLVVYETRQSSSFHSAIESAVWATDTDLGHKAARVFMWTRLPGPTYQFSLVRNHGDYVATSKVSKLIQLSSVLHDDYDRLEIRYDGMYFADSKGDLGHWLVRF